MKARFNSWAKKNWQTARLTNHNNKIVSNRIWDFKKTTNDFTKWKRVIRECLDQLYVKQSKACQSKHITTHQQDTNKNHHWGTLPTRMTVTENKSKKQKISNNGSSAEKTEPMNINCANVVENSMVVPQTTDENRIILSRKSTYGSIPKRKQELKQISVQPCS